MLSLAKSRYRILVQFVFSSMNALGVALAISYNARTPDLYPNNAHHKIGWIITAIAAIDLCISFFDGIARVTSSRVKVQFEEPELALMSSALQDHDPVDSSDNTSTSHGSSHSSETEIGSLPGDEHVRCDEPFKCADQEERDSLLPMANSRRRFSAQVQEFLVSSTFRKYLIITSRIVNYIVLPFGFVAVATGIVTYARFFVRSWMTTKIM